MVIGFKEQFVPLILNGVKKHTIRKDKHERWSSGKPMHMATGVRTKKYKEFDIKICTGTQKISIRYYNNVHRIEVRINDRFFGSAYYDQERIFCNYSELENLAKNDGFNSLKDFFDWFDKDFDGKIIHWTNLRYGTN